MFCFPESVGGAEASDSSAERPEVSMLMSRGEERELPKCSPAIGGGSLSSIPFGSRHVVNSVVAGGLGVLVEAAQVLLVWHSFCFGDFFCE
jgi:hypothetical protein